jgi:UDP-N-acetylglucosamine:LPS N-acetylglucosamine transferase
MSDDTLDQVVGKGRKLHVICLCGDTTRPENHAFMQELNALRGSKRVRIHGCPATPQIAELVSLPEMRLVISKPGGSTVGEMIKKRVFTLYHTSSHALDWEKGNIEYGEARGYGKRCILEKKTPTEFSALLVEAASLSRAMRSALVPEAQIDFADTLRQTVDLMLEKKERISKNKG